MNIEYVFKNISGTRRDMSTVGGASESLDIILYNGETSGK